MKWKRIKEDVVEADDELPPLLETTSPTVSPPPKRSPKHVRFAETCPVRTYLIDSDKEMKKTGPVKKRKWEEFFPGFKEQLLAKVMNRDEKDGVRCRALGKLERLLDTNERVEKIKRGDYEPLRDDEKTDFTWRKLQILEESKKRREEQESEQKEEEKEDPPTPPPPNSMIEDVSDIRVTADSYAGINCQYMIANEINKGGSCKEIQDRIDNKLKYIEFIYYLPGKHVKLHMCVADRKMNSKVPVGYDGDEAKRYCASCKTNIKLTDWPQHLSTMFHQVMFKYRALRLSLCWTGFNGRLPHIPSECNTCLTRLDKNSSDKDILMEDYTRYNAEEDRDLIENMSKEFSEQQTVNKVEKQSEHQCPVCPEKKMYSEEFLQKHLTGRYHKEKLKKLSEGQKSKSPPTTTSEKKQTPQTTTNTTSQPKTVNTKTTKSPTKKKGPFIENCIKTIMGQSGKPEWECKICDIKMKFQRNVNSHLKTKRHMKNKKEIMVTTDETVEVETQVRDSNNLEELGFVRDAGEKGGRPGVHFLVTTEKPVKYKVGKRMARFMYSCQLCCRYFRSAGLLRRHREGKEHVLRYRNLKRHQRMKKRFLKKKLQIIEKKYHKETFNGRDQTEFTHGDVMNKIFFRHPHLKWVSVLKNKRQRFKKQKERIQKFAGCDEFTDQHQFVHSHSHLYVETKEKMLFTDFKKMMWKDYNLKCTDIKRPVNFREVIRYISKQDKHALIHNIPIKYTSTGYRARLYGLTHSRVNYADYIPSTVAACDRKVFEDAVKEERELNEGEIICKKTEFHELRQWQQQLIDILKKEDNDRRVFWVYDHKGGTGKSYMCQYLLKSGGILFPDFNYRDNCYLYNSEPIVMFDLARSSVSPMDMRLVEDLKNGYVISTKYEVRRKIFASPTIIIFSNSLPKSELLSNDRWYVVEIMECGDLYRHEHYSQEEEH